MKRLALPTIAIALAVFAGAGSASPTSTPRNESPPSIDGAALEGSVLRADHGRWSTRDVSYAYQWQRCLTNGSGCASVPNATDRIYAAGVADVGHSLRLVVAATSKSRQTGLAQSNPTAEIRALPPSAPHLASPPVISGNATPGQLLTASAGSWSGAAPISYSYRWRRCDSAGGNCEDTFARAQSYALNAADVNGRVRVLVTARNGSGSSSALSDPSVLIPRSAPPAPPAKPQSTGAPAVSGVTQEGQTLRGSVGAWSNRPTSFAYSWLRCDRTGSSCGTIGGARRSSYSLGRDDVGRTMRLQVEARNSGGRAIATSAPTAVIAAKPVVTKAPPANTAGPRITGTVQEGQTLTADRGSWSNSPTSYEYSWRRCASTGNGCNGIGGARSTTYKVTADDIGRTLRFRVTAKNADGSTDATSAQTAAVRASARPDNTAPPVISGTPQEGKPLAGSRGSWGHNPSAYSYAWLRCDRNGGSCAAIGGAAGAGYTPGSADVGNTVRVRVTAANSEGSDSATSVPTAVIQKAAGPAQPSRGAGCPAGGNPDQVASINGPAQLILDALQSTPTVVTRSTASLVVRFHVTSTCGGPVQGALVYTTATPFNQFTVPPEAMTGADGWATLTLQRLTGFPTSKRQRILALFARARKPGDNVLAGITAFRLFSVRVG